MIKIRYLKDISSQEKKNILSRKTLALDEVWNDTIAPMVTDFEKSPMDALALYNKKFDGFHSSPAVMEREEMESHYLQVKKTSPETLEAFEMAMENIQEFHRQQIPSGFETRVAGNLLGFLFSPMERVALYVPGGKANYPSTVMMGVIPATLAGVKEIVLLNPPQKETSQTIPVLAAIAWKTGVNRIVKSGGAQSILAAAFGVPELGLEPVDFIYGPGNKYVAAAKNYVFSRNIAGIDSYAGPSEVVILADSSARPAYLAHDLMAQAEHDEDAMAILLTDDADIARQTAEKIELILQRREKENDGQHSQRLRITRDSIEKNGHIIITENLRGAVEFSNRFAPEHLEIQTRDNDGILNDITSAGSIFMGEYAPVAVGDYYSGTNHILPTGGAARFSSGVSVHSFYKRITYQKITRDGLERGVQPIVRMSQEENLYDEHGISVEARFREDLC